MLLLACVAALEEGWGGHLDQCVALHNRARSHAWGRGGRNEGLCTLVIFAFLSQEGAHSLPNLSLCLQVSSTGEVNNSGCLIGMMNGSQTEGPISPGKAQTPPSVQDWVGLIYSPSIYMCVHLIQCTIFLKATWY